MGNRRWTRLLALIMAVVCTLTVVAAIDFDQNGDGKVTVWDLQKMVGKSDYDATLRQVLGGKGDELNPNSDGWYEIWSELGWRNFVKNANKGMNFKLMADIDLKNADWTPIVFSGNFDGNGKTVKNVNITKAVSGRGSDNMGFFAVIEQYTKDGATVQSQVQNLNLDNVNLTAADNAVYIGLLAGTNLGIVTNCTATGKVTDERTELTKNVYVGALLGRNHNATDTIPAGKLNKGTGPLLTATAGTGNADDKVEGVSAKLATFYAEATGSKRYTGIVGFSASANMSSDMIWQDTSNLTSYKSQAEQTRRNTVEAEMYKMGTVKWTPSQTVTFTRFDDPTLLHSNAYIAGKTYTGLPYVGARDGSYDRFMSQMQAQKDDQGRYVTVPGLKNGTQSNDYKYDGFVTMMGNSCHWAVIWSWSTVSPHRTDNGYGGVAVNELNHMIPTAANVTGRGALPVGNYVVADGLDTDVEATQKIIANNGVTAMAECYAQAGKGDAIVFKGITLGGAEDGHTRMLSQDPVIIRKGATGTANSNPIDLDKSYIQFHGQGDGLLADKSGETYGKFKVKYTSWLLNHKVTLNALLTKAGAQAANDGGYWGFVPVTINAFSAAASFEKNKAPYCNVSGTVDPIVLPNTGKYYSNYKNVSATMVIKDADSTVYEKTAYMMATTITPNVFYEPDLSVLFPDADEALTVGQTYTVTLKFKTANGTETVPYVDKAKTALVENYQFTYNG